MAESKTVGLPEGFVRERNPTTGLPQTRNTITGAISPGKTDPPPPPTWLTTDSTGTGLPNGVAVAGAALGAAWLFGWL